MPLYTYYTIDYVKSQYSLVSTSVNITFFDGLALVIFFLAAGGGDSEFDMSRAAVESDWDDGEAILLGAGEAGNLALGREQFDIADSLGAEGEVVEPELAILNRDERAFELGVVIANQPDLGASQNHATNQLLAERIIIARATIDGDVIRRPFLFHVIIIT